MSVDSLPDPSYMVSIMEEPTGRSPDLPDLSPSLTRPTWFQSPSSPWIIETVNTTLLRLEKWGAKILAVFESFVYRDAANPTLLKLASQVKNSIFQQGIGQKGNMI